MIAEIDCEIIGPNPAGSGETLPAFFRPIQVCGSSRDSYYVDFKLFYLPGDTMIVRPLISNVTSPVISIIFNTSDTVT